MASANSDRGGGRKNSTKYSKIQSFDKKSQNFRKSDEFVMNRSNLQALSEGDLKG
jgi:hypothetical protein